VHPSSFRTPTIPVIPAKAGTHFAVAVVLRTYKCGLLAEGETGNSKMGSGFRRNDGGWEVRSYRHRHRYRHRHSPFAIRHSPFAIAIASASASAIAIAIASFGYRRRESIRPNPPKN